ncbi:MAG: hypothetical protein ACLUKN_05125 [Bacilli bacterium]
MRAKRLLCDKPPFTTLEQLSQARKLVAETGLKYMPYFAERVHNEAAEKADELIKAGEIGRSCRSNSLRTGCQNRRAGWFFEREEYGGILCDIGSTNLSSFCSSREQTRLL